MQKIGSIFKWLGPAQWAHICWEIIIGGDTKCILALVAYNRRPAYSPPCSTTPLTEDQHLCLHLAADKSNSTLPDFYKCDKIIFVKGNSKYVWGGAKINHTLHGIFRDCHFDFQGLSLNFCVRVCLSILTSGGVFQFKHHGMTLNLNIMGLSQKKLSFRIFQQDISKH